MADHIELDEGSSGKKTETIEISSGIHRQVMSLGSISACVLRKTKCVAQKVTCTLADTDYVVANPLAVGTKYLTVYANNAIVIAMGEATSDTCGITVAGSTTMTFPVVRTGVTADDKVHVRSSYAGTGVRFTEMAD